MGLVTADASPTSTSPLGSGIVVQHLVCGEVYVGAVVPYGTLIGEYK